MKEGKGVRRRIFGNGAKNTVPLPSTGRYLYLPPKPAFCAEKFRPHQFDNSRLAMPGGVFNNPRVIISCEAALDMYYIAGHSGNNEVGWLGTITQVGEILRIEEIFLFHQKVTASSTDLNEEHIAQIATQLIQGGNIDKVNALKFWGHVHPGNSTSPSQQDDDTMKILENGNSWFLRGIFGRNGRAEFCLFDYERRLIFKDIPWEIEVVESATRKQTIKEQVDEMVKGVVYPLARTVYQSLPLSGDSPESQFPDEMGQT